MARTIAASGLTAAFFSAFVITASFPARADDCGPLKRAAAVDMIPAAGGVEMIPVTINGQPKRLLLDTAGGISALSQTAVADLGLHPLGSRRRLLNRTGEASNSYVNVVDFAIGSLAGKDLEFMVSPNAQMGKNPNLPIDGVIAGDMMEQNDLEMDFAAGKLNYFLPDHCSGRVVYWPATVVAIVPFSTQRPGVMGNRDTHIRVPVTLDGKEFGAIIATGSPRSTMSAATAKYVFGITADSPGSVPLGVIGNDPDHKVFGHVFGGLTFEGVTVANPRIAIIPDLIGTKDPNNDLRTGSFVKHADDDIGPEVTIGMDVLKHLHLYLAARERKLYITPAAAAAPAPAAQ